MGWGCGPRQHPYPTDFRNPPIFANAAWRRSSASLSQASARRARVRTSLVVVRLPKRHTALRQERRSRHGGAPEPFGASPISPGPLIAQAEAATPADLRSQRHAEPCGVRSRSPGWRSSACRPDLADQCPCRARPRGLGRLRLAGGGGPRRGRGGGHSVSPVGPQSIARRPLRSPGDWRSAPAAFVRTPPRRVLSGPCVGHRGPSRTQCGEPPHQSCRGRAPFPHRICGAPSPSGGAPTVHTPESGSVG